MAREKKKNKNKKQVGRPWLLKEVTAPLLRCATLGAAKAVIHGIYYAIQAGSISTNDFMGTLSRMGEDVVLWGTVGAVYGAIRIGLELIKRDWMDAFIACAVTSAVILAVVNKDNDVIVLDPFVLGFILGIAYYAYNRATGK